MPQSLDSVLQETAVLSGAEYISAEINLRLEACKKPVLFFGERLKHNSRLIDEVLNFCQARQIPYASSLFAKGMVDETAPLCLGAYNGILSRPQARCYIENEADYLIEICTSIHPQDTSTAFGTETYILHTFKNKTCLRGTAVRCNDVLEVFQQLNQTKSKTFTWQPEPVKEKATSNETKKIEFANIAEILNNYQSRRAECFVYIPEVGNSFFSSFSLRTKKSELGRSWLSNPFYAAMGTSLPYAHAVCKNIQERKLTDIPLVLTGDGGFHFQCNELINFQRSHLFLIILYFKNNIFHLGKMSDAKIYQSSDSGFDPIQFVKAYGGQGRTVESADELSVALDECLLHRKGIHLLEIPVSIDEVNQSPEVQIINTFIKAKSGDAKAIATWAQLNSSRSPVN